MVASEVIEQLNRAHRSYDMPSFYLYYPIDARMSVFRSDCHWAIVFENFVFSDRCFDHNAITTSLTCFGDDLPQAPGWSDPPLEVTRDGPSGPLFSPGTVGEVISPAATDMMVRDTIVPITLDPKRYAEAGIKLKRPPEIQTYELLRFLAPRYGNLFFATDVELVERIGARLPLLIRLHEWRHYDMLYETPAECEAFQMIADAIAHDDPSRYCPTQRPNTHWSNWPDSPMV